MRVKKIAIWCGVGAAGLLLCVGAFALSRYLGAGGEYAGELADLAPAEASVVLVIDDFPRRYGEIDRFIDKGLLESDELASLEASPTWRNGPGKSLGGDLAGFKRERLDRELAKLRQQLDGAGLELFVDVLAGEVLVCVDYDGPATEYVVLTRVSHDVRVYWRFLDVGLMFADTPPGTDPELEQGVLRIKRPAPKRRAASFDEEAAPAGPEPDLLVTLLDDVAVLSNSPRLLNSVVAAHAGEAPGLSATKPWQRARKASEKQSKAHTLGMFVNLDRLRRQLAPVEVAGRMESPVDSYNYLPVSVIRLNPDVFAPVDLIVQRNLDTKVFGQAFYGIDLSDPARVGFDQYLLPDAGRLSRADYAYLRKTWAQPRVKPGQFAFLPPDTMFQVSFRQPLDVLRGEVLDERARLSFVGDFMTGLKDVPVEEIVMALGPSSYAPGLVEPLSQMPLPAFLFAFRAPGASPDKAGSILQGFLDNLRGRKSTDARKGALSVRPETLDGLTIYGFSDARAGTPDETSDTRLALALVIGQVGDWLVVTNSREIMRGAIRASRGQASALVTARRDSWGADLPDQNATLFASMDGLIAYLHEPGLIELLRKNKFNESLIEGRDAGAIRREITAALGLDPANQDHLQDPRVASEFEKRKQAWVEKCRREGPQFATEFSRDVRALRLFKDFSLFTQFSEEALYARGVLNLR